MFLNHVKMAFRSLRRNKMFSLLNIVGLAVGLAGCLLMAGYVVHELSYDRMHIRKDRIFRVNGRIPFGNEVVPNAVVGGPLGPAAKESIPEIEESVRIRRAFEVPIRAGNKDFKERMILMAEPQIFDVFTIPLVRGNPKTALAAPFTVVISESFARQCFGAEDPVGRTLRLEFTDPYDFQVTGVMKDIPSNSVLSRPVFASFASLLQINPTSVTKWEAWGSTSTFFLLRPGADPDAVGAKITDLAKARLGPEESKGVSYVLQPLRRIYLDGSRLSMSNELAGSANMTQVYIFAAVALLILLIAAINFVNLSTAKIARRMKEVGVRKTCGAERSSLVRQFLTESVLVAAGAMALGLAFFELFKPRLDSYLGKELSLSLFSGPWLVLILSGLVFIVGLLAGSYPAFYISRFPAAVVFRSGLASPTSKAGLRRVLVVCQFFIAVVLIASTLVILKQVRYSETKDLGYESKNLVLLQIRDSRRLKNVDVLKNEILARSQATAAGAIAFLPSGQNRGISMYRSESSPTAKGVMAQGLTFDPDFIPAFGLKLVAGRNFEAGRAADADCALVNETAVKEMGLTNPVGLDIYRGNKTMKIIGVVRDWHTNSLHSRIESVVMTLADKTAGSLVVRLPKENGQAVLAQIRDIWNRLLPGQVFDPAYVDEFMAKTYQKERRLAGILLFFCGLTIFVACLGIFGLASFSAEQKTKEIGIRKVLGANIAGIVGLLSKSYARWVLAASVAACPVAYLAVKKWLQGFAYRTSIGPVPFLLAGLFALGIALVAIAVQTVKAATANPIDSLKYE
jgi:putative ABC transport system permease protein